MPQNWLPLVSQMAPGAKEYNVNSTVSKNGLIRFLRNCYVYYSFWNLLSFVLSLDMLIIKNEAFLLIGNRWFYKNIKFS